MAARIALAVIVALAALAGAQGGGERASPYTSQDDVHRAGACTYVGFAVWRVSHLTLSCLPAVLRFQAAAQHAAWENREAVAADKRCDGGRDKKVVSMSLYGNGSQTQNFADGAIANCRVLARLYPGWVLRVYTSSGAAIAAQLQGAGAEVVEMEEPEGIYGMFWRFFAASDPCVSLAVFRDTGRNSQKSWRFSHSAVTNNNTLSFPHFLQTR